MPFFGKWRKRKQKRKDTLQFQVARAKGAAIRKFREVVIPLKPSGHAEFKPLEREYLRLREKLPEKQGRKSLQSYESALRRMQIKHVTIKLDSFIERSRKARNIVARDSAECQRLLNELFSFSKDEGKKYLGILRRTGYTVTNPPWLNG